MSEIEKIQQDYTANRMQTANATTALKKAMAKLDNLNATEKVELKNLHGQDKIIKKTAIDNKRKEINAEIEQLKSQKSSLKANFNNMSAAFLPHLNPIEQVNSLSDSFPILMFPLRLETRFKSENNQHQLWLRVYPDDCNINKKEELLSASELKNAAVFWMEMWKAAGIESEERGAWRSLVNSYGSGRSAWIISQYKPIGNKPIKINADYRVLVVTSSFSLTAIEHQAARTYWTSVWLAKSDPVKLAAALNSLETAVGEVRAAEITEEYVPVNISDNPPEAITADKVLLEKLELPSADDYVTTQTTWNKAPEAVALPDRFAAIAYTATGKRTVLFSHAVKEHLPVGPDPSLNADEQIQKNADGNMVVNEDLEWMVDFEKAVSSGMAMKIALSPQEAVTGFDKLFVLGIRLSANENTSKTQLETLLNDHFHSKDGFGLIKQGTPTNNTADEPSGNSWIDDSDESYDRIFKHTADFQEKQEWIEKSDGQKLADALGISADILKQVPNANGRDQLEANAMNTALFPATLGYFMEEMMQPLFDDRDIDAAKTFFSNFVSGRGPIPAIRIGKQPYGILPISVYSRLSFRNSNIRPGTVNNRIPFLKRLHELIMKMDKSWDKLVPQVAYVGKPGDQHQILLDVIGLHANSVEFHQRYAQSIQQVYNQMNLQSGPFFASFIASVIANRGKVILEELEVELGETKLPILEKYFMSEPNLLEGHLVDDIPESELNTIRPYSSDGKNYIEWLAASDAEKIRAQDFGGLAAPTALLFLLLKHSLMQAQADAASRLMLNHKIIESKSTFYDPPFIHVQKDGKGKSKFEHLFSTNATITGNDYTNISAHIYKNNILREAEETIRLRETIDALKVLEKTPTARLGRLLIEHLDCCNYRIDAWKTGLVNYKLTEQRASTANQLNGLYLGAYGWLTDLRPKTGSANLGYIHAPSINQAATSAILRNAYDTHKSSGTGNPFNINLTSDRVRLAKGFLEGMRNGQNLAALLGYQFEKSLHDKHNLGQGEVDMFIYPLRKAFPLVADQLADTKIKSEDLDEAVESNNLPDTSAFIQTVEANNVVNGLSLIKTAEESGNKTYPFGLPTSLNMPHANALQAKAINEELVNMINIHDAIADLVLSEQVYQVVQGNFERASGNAEAFSKGSYPPEIDVVNTPRSGTTLTQRMAIQFDAEASDSISPNVIPMTPRAIAEPGVNKWLSEILPDPNHVCCIVAYSSPAQSEITELVSQEHLGLQAIDLLYSFNLDTEQAMTELDDRIVHYIRYSRALHPKTEVKIQYTEVIDKLDKTKISFFELAALIRNLRKMLIGAKLLNPSVITLPTAGTKPAFAMDDVLLNTRVTAIKTSLLNARAAIESRINATKSIAQLTISLKALLGPHITDNTLIETLASQLTSDLQAALADSSAINKNRLIDNYELNISTIPNPATIAALKMTYNSILDDYLGDFSNFDTLVQQSTNSFLTVAMFDHTQTGTGFMQQGVSNVYNSIFQKLDATIERWNEKVITFNSVLAAYDPAGIPEVQLPILQKAERTISTHSSTPPPAIIAYKALIDTKKVLFDQALLQLIALKTNAKQKVTDFIVDVESVVKNLNNYDVIAFDTINSVNDLRAEKWTIALLKEDIYISLENLRKALSKKNTDAETSLETANATSANSHKITSLLQAAKHLFGEEALILPQFTLETEQALEFENSYANSDGLLDFVKINENRIFPVEDWLAGVSKVREKIQFWENAEFLSAAFNSNTSMDLVPMQFPYKENDRWGALKFIDENDAADTFNMNSDKLLYTAHFATVFDKAKPQCGIVLDEWTEVIPAKKETTGIAFNYDQPNSEPAQTMLLVVPPVIKGTWEWEDIVNAMEETLEMVKKRAIEPAHIDTTAYAQFLPTTMMAVTLYWITVATNLSLNNNFYQKVNDN